MSRALDLVELADQLATLAAVRGHSVRRDHWLAVRRHLADLSEGRRSDAPALLAAVTELQTSGWVQREHAIAELPIDLRWLFEAGVLKLSHVDHLARVLGAVTAADLQEAVEHRVIRGEPMLGADVEQALSAGLAALRDAAPYIPIGRALAAAEPLLECARAVPGVTWAMPAGSLRRGHDLVSDIELVVEADEPAPVLTAISEGESVEHVSFCSADRLIVTVGRVQVACRCLDVTSASGALMAATGSREHIAALRNIAVTRGLTLTPHGLVGDDGRLLGRGSESAFYAALGLPWIPPELRTGDDEIARARAGTLPDLIQRDDILGDLHVHTTWSDGRDSVRTMVATALAIGYRFIAITDHSPSSAAAKNLKAEDVSKQAEEIARVREQFPQIAILHGCEVDILADGRLDFPDKTLRRFDVVLASLHDRAGHSSHQLLGRYLAAMAHPLVTLVTHPTNRSFPREQGYDMDYDRLFEAAVETRTVLEIDGAPSHVDLDAARAASAAAKGVMLAISSDSHAASQLKRHMDIGVLTARRGRVERKHVLNSRTLPEIRALIASKRSRFPV